MLSSLERWFCEQDWTQPYGGHQHRMLPEHVRTANDLAFQFVIFNHNDELVGFSNSGSLVTLIAREKVRQLLRATDGLMC